MVSWRFYAHADHRQLMKSLVDGLVGFIVMHDQGWHIGFQSGSYQATNLAVVNILSLFANRSIVFFAVWQGGSSILHEKYGTTM